MKFPVIDGHADTIGRYLEDPAGFFAAAQSGHLDSRRLRETGQNVQVMAIYTPPPQQDGDALRYARDFIRAYDAVLDSRANAELDPPYRRILTAADLRAACRPGSFGFLLFMEGASPLRGDLENLELFFDLGVRGITITHNHDNEAARGCLAEGQGKGLTAFGRQLVRAMEARGMVVDVAHANEDAFWDTIEIARGPLVDSHTGLRKFWDHPRNLGDSQLAALAKGGGVACIDFFPDHLATRAEPKAPVGIDRVVHVIRYAAERAGIDSVGLGSDWDGFGETIEGLEDCSRLPRLGEAMAADGFRDEEIAKVFGGNLLRVFCSVLP
jgi:membrane dipeptidase